MVERDVLEFPDFIRSVLIDFRNIGIQIFEHIIFLLEGLFHSAFKFAYKRANFHQAFIEFFKRFSGDAFQMGFACLFKILYERWNAL